MIVLIINSMKNPAAELGSARDGAKEYFYDRFTLWRGGQHRT